MKTLTTFAQHTERPLMKAIADAITEAAHSLPEDRLSEGVLTLATQADPPIGSVMHEQLSVALTRVSNSRLHDDAAQARSSQDNTRMALSAVNRARCLLFCDEAHEERLHSYWPLPTGIYRYKIDAYINPLVLVVNTRGGQFYAAFAHDFQDYMSAQNQYFTGAYLLYTVARALAAFDGYGDKLLQYGVAGLFNPRPQPLMVLKGGAGLEQFSEKATRFVPFSDVDMAKHFSDAELAVNLWQNHDDAMMSKALTALKQRLARMGEYGAYFG